MEAALGTGVHAVDQQSDHSYHVIMLLRVFPIFAAALLLPACTAKPEAPDDPDAAVFLAENPGLTKECAAEARKNVMAGGTADVENCYELTAPKRWSGLLDLGWEWSNFCPAPAAKCYSSSEHGDVWTEFAHDANGGPRLQDGLYEVEFVGRRTVQPGHFGHLNQYDYYMVVDRMISVRKLPEGNKK